MTTVEDTTTPIDQEPVDQNTTNTTQQVNENNSTDQGPVDQNTTDTTQQVNENNPTDQGQTLNELFTQATQNSTFTNFVSALNNQSGDPIDMLMHMVNMHDVNAKKVIIDVLERALEKLYDEDEDEDYDEDEDEDYDEDEDEDEDEDDDEEYEYEEEYEDDRWNTLATLAEGHRNLTLTFMRLLSEEGG